MERINPYPNGQLIYIASMHELGLVFLFDLIMTRFMRASGDLPHKLVSAQVERSHTVECFGMRSWG